MTAQDRFDIVKDFHSPAGTDDRGSLLFSHRVDNTPDVIPEALTELLAVRPCRMFVCNRL